MRPPAPRTSTARRWLALSLVWLSTACGSTPLAGNPHFAAATVTITADGLRPEAEVRIAPYGTIAFRNELPTGNVEIEVARPFAPSANCSTTLNFAAAGPASTTPAIPPHGLASICFHAAGAFPFVVRTPIGEQHGRVLVGGAR